MSGAVDESVAGNPQVFAGFCVQGQHMFDLLGFAVGFHLHRIGVMVQQQINVRFGCDDFFFLFIAELLVGAG